MQLFSAFQQTTSGTQRFKLRLLELLVVSCHQIAVYLYDLDDGVHKHAVYEQWRDLPRTRIEPGQYFAPAVFFHDWYVDLDQYPNGVADVVGYWAEAKILGVVIFDRGESETEVGLRSRIASALINKNHVPNPFPVQRRLSQPGPHNHPPTNTSTVRSLNQLAFATGPFSGNLLPDPHPRDQGK